MPAGAVAFQPHIRLLEHVLSRREAIVEHVQELLNARRKPDAYLRDRPRLFRLFEDCVFAGTGITDDQARLRGQLDAAHRAGGFAPRELPGLHNSLVDPAEMMVRGFYLWQQTRWPGRNGRIAYAHTLFNLYVIRCLTMLSLRLWDSGPHGAADRLSQIQDVLDRLWATTGSDQPVLVRDARWLIPLAQSPATEDLAPYFDVSESIADTLPAEVRIGIHRAGVCMAAAHLRSQIHYYSTKKAVSLDEERLVAGTRTSNALDFALLIQDLVPLLDAYEHAAGGGDRETRRRLAGAICQGISPDPDLFVNRLDLLRPYSMIEQLFTGPDGEGGALYTPMGQRHVRIVEEYAARIRRLAAPLSEDCPSVRPMAGAYSPYGILYGFSSDLIEHMVLRTLLPDAVTHLGLEDVFTDGDSSGEKLAWVTGWRKLPHVDRDVQKRFEYPQAFAEAIFDRMERALRRGAAHAGSAAARTGRLWVVPEDDAAAGTSPSRAPDLPVRYMASSDMALVTARTAVHRDEAHLAGDRHEGRCLVSYRTPGGSVALSKAVLTEFLGAGHDVRVAGLPPAAAAAVTLMCPELVVLPEHASHRSAAGDPPA